MNNARHGILILTILVLSGCGNTETQKDNNGNSTIEISVEKSPPASPAPETKTEGRNAQVHGGNPTPNAMGGARPLPAGHPTVKPQMPAGHPPIPGAQPPGHPPMKRGMPAGHPPFANRARGPMMNRKPLANDGAATPLETGPHSPSADMLAGKKTIGEPALKTQFEEAFRKTFTQNRSLRDYNGAEKLLNDVLAAHPKHPQSLRTMGYVAVNQGFNVEKAMKYYLLSVQAEDTYGPGHYALAFMYARGDREKGGKHYLRAMELGVPDARSIGKSFYPHLVQPAAPDTAKDKE